MIFYSFLYNFSALNNSDDLKAFIGLQLDMSVCTRCISLAEKMGCSPRAEAPSRSESLVYTWRFTSNINLQVTERS